MIVFIKQGEGGLLLRVEECHIEDGDFFNALGRCRELPIRAVQIDDLEDAVVET